MGVFVSNSRMLLQRFSPERPGIQLSTRQRSNPLAPNQIKGFCGCLRADYVIASQAERENQQVASVFVILGAENTAFTGSHGTPFGSGFLGKIGRGDMYVIAHSRKKQREAALGRQLP